MAVRFILWSEALRKSQSFELWSEIVDACWLLPRGSECRITEFRISEGAGESRGVEVYRGPAVGVTSDALEHEE